MKSALSLTVLTLLLILSSGTYAGLRSLQSGVGVNNENINTIAQTSWDYAKASTTQEKFNDGFASAFLRVFNSTDLYSLSSSNNLYLTNFNTRDVLGSWPLIPWQNRIKMKGEGINWNVRSALDAVFGGKGEPINDPEAQVFDTDSTYKLDAWNDYLGCYSRTPLRYGDIDTNGSNELVLFLDDDLIVFSPSLQKTIFSTRLHYQDELASDQIEVAYGEDPRDDLIYQYYAASGDDIHINAPFPATRSYAKIFVGDFNEDKTPDIILWRKLYESRLNSDSVKGFKKVADLLVHYQLTDGEYLPRTTPPETIKNWLSTAQLTWQKGYPSTSECAGQDGELIPEMHDPLLNDPDVLQ